MSLHPHPPLSLSPAGEEWGQVIETRRKIAPTSQQRRGRQMKAGIGHFWWPGEKRLLAVSAWLGAWQVVRPQVTPERGGDLQHKPCLSTGAHFVPAADVPFPGLSRLLAPALSFSLLPLHQTLFTAASRPPSWLTQGFLLTGHNPQ